MVDRYLDLLVFVEVGFGPILDVVVQREHGLARVGHPHLCALGRESQSAQPHQEHVPATKWEQRGRAHRDP
jgi:hypothetical protein